MNRTFITRLIALWKFVTLTIPMSQRLAIEFVFALTAILGQFTFILSYSMTGPDRGDFSLWASIGFEATILSALTTITLFGLAAAPALTALFARKT